MFKVQLIHKSPWKCCYIEFSPFSNLSLSKILWQKNNVSFSKQNCKTILIAGKETFGIKKEENNAKCEEDITENEIKEAHIKQEVR